MKESEFLATKFPLWMLLVVWIVLDIPKPLNLQFYISTSKNVRDNVVLSII